jgi:hypothetical protein
LTTDQKVSGLNPDGVTKPARTVRAFLLRGAVESSLSLRRRVIKKQKHQQS